MTSGLGTVNIFIREWLNVFGLGVVAGYSATNLNVEGSIISSLCRSADSQLMEKWSIRRQNLQV
jgi:hypothetical protein